MTTINHGHWNLNYILTSSAGIQIYHVKYKGKQICWDASLPYVTIDHQSQDLTSTDETNDDHGSFWIPLGTRNLCGDIEVNQFDDGFEITANFSTHPKQEGYYNYTQIWRFYDDGKLAPMLLLKGPGLHPSHAYHPHWRFDFDLGPDEKDDVEYYDGQQWVCVKEEGWFPIAGESNKDGSVWRQTNKRSGVSVHLRPHQLEDGELFAIRYDDSQGHPFTPKTSLGGHAFPANYSGRSSIVGHDVALWYVAHVHYSDSFPFASGPWIKVST